MVAWFVAAALVTVLGSSSRGESKAPGHRKFRFVYGATITDLKPGAKARVWIPVAQSSDHQQVKVIDFQLPAGYRKTKDNLGNEYFYVEAKANANGEIPLSVVYDVTRNEVLPTTGDKFDKALQDTYLKADKLVPIDGKVTTAILGEAKPQGDAMHIARLLYDKVDAHVKYDKPAGGDWGRGDSLWVCDSKYGNCTDFHSLFISLARHQHIPARFEIGFPIPTDKETGSVGGYHCWAWFANADRWVAVDISEADKHPEMKEYYFGHLTPDRVCFTTGRDLRLQPSPDSGPVNFLIYPYVEVEGKPHTKFTKQFSYENLP